MDYSQLFNGKFPGGVWKQMHGVNLAVYSVPWDWELKQRGVLTGPSALHHFYHVMH